MSQAPEGWYPNPANPAEELYWLGDRWSNASRPVAGATAPSPAAPPVTPATRTAVGIGQPSVPTVPASATATATLTPVPAREATECGKWALYLGLAAVVFALIPAVRWMVFIPVIAALIFGVMALVRPNDDRKRALAGMAIGAAAGLLAIVLAASSAAADPDDASSDTPIAAEEVVEEPAVEPEPEPTEEPAVEPAPAPAPEPAPKPGYGTYPDAQAQFVQIVEDSAAAISAAETDLQRSQLLITRDQALCAVPGVAGVVDNWVGEVHDIGANGDGLAYVSIEIAPTILVKTWNNAFSDIGDDTLIGPNVPFFQTLIPMTEGTKVTFSGDFLNDDAVCVQGANLTEVFYGSDPDFLFRFSNVAAQ